MIIDSLYGLVKATVFQVHSKPSGVLWSQGRIKERLQLGQLNDDNTNIYWTLILCQVLWWTLYIHCLIYSWIPLGELFFLTPFYRCVNWGLNKLTLCPKASKYEARMLPISNLRALPLTSCFSSHTCKSSLFIDQYILHRESPQFASFLLSLL